MRQNGLYEPCVLPVERRRSVGSVKADRHHACNTQWNDRADDVSQTIVAPKVIVELASEELAIGNEMTTGPYPRDPVGGRVRDRSGRAIGPEVDRSVMLLVSDHSR